MDTWSVPVDRWIGLADKYLDRMGERTREYMQGLRASISSALHTGNGFYSVPEFLDLIAGVSQVDDNLGLAYAKAIEESHVPLGFLRAATDPGIVEAARENPDEFLAFLGSLRKRDSRSASGYAEKLGLPEVSVFD